MSGPRCEQPTDFSARQTIYFCGSSLYFSEALLSAVAREFTEFSVVCMRDFRSGLHPEIQLVLVAPDRMADFDAVVTDVTTACPAARLVFCYEDDEKARALLAEHMSGVVARQISLMPMNVRLDAWMSYLRLFLQGQTHISTNLIGSFETPAPVSRTRPVSAALQKLTTREAEILALAAQGEQNKIIASQLKISEHTVKLHMHRVIRKLGVRNRTEAAHCLLRAVS